MTRWITPYFRTTGPLTEGGSPLLSTMGYKNCAGGCAYGEARVLKTFSRAQVPGKVLFSPDGRYLAYDVEQFDSRNRDIWLISLDGTQTALVENPADDYMLAWLPDGILFASDRTAPWTCGGKRWRMESRKAPRSGS